MNRISKLVHLSVVIGALLGLAGHALAAPTDPVTVTTPPTDGGSNPSMLVEMTRQNGRGSLTPPPVPISASQQELFDNFSFTNVPESMVTASRGTVLVPVLPSGTKLRSV